MLRKQFFVPISDVSVKGLWIDMKILVTGANGLLGHHVVMKLLDCNEQVNIIVRKTENIYFDLDSVNVFTGNFTDVENLKKAAAGCDAIIHCAAITATNLLRYADYETVNVAGSATVIRVAEELKISMLVFVSTANSIGFGTAENPADETHPAQFPFTASYYAQSKSAAEKLFIQAAEKAGNQVVILHPCFIIGGFDTKKSSGRLVKMGYKKPLLFIPKGGKNFVSAKKVAEAVCNALTKGKNGERYLVCGENLSFKDFFEKQKRVGAYGQKIVEIPDWILKWGGKWGDFLRKFGVKSDVCTINMEQLLVNEFYTGEKGEQALTLRNDALENAIRDAVEWLKNKV